MQKKFFRVCCDSWQIHMYRQLLTLTQTTHLLSSYSNGICTATLVGRTNKFHEPADTSNPPLLVWFVKLFTNSCIICTLLRIPVGRQEKNNHQAVIQNLIKKYIETAPPIILFKRRSQNLAMVGQGCSFCFWMIHFR